MKEEYAGLRTGKVFVAKLPEHLRGKDLTGEDLDNIPMKEMDLLPASFKEVSRELNRLKAPNPWRYSISCDCPCSVDTFRHIIGLPYPLGNPAPSFPTFFTADYASSVYRWKQNRAYYVWGAQWYDNYIDDVVTENPIAYYATHADHCADLDGLITHSLVKNCISDLAITLVRKVRQTWCDNLEEMLRAIPRLRHLKIKSSSKAFRLYFTADEMWIYKLRMRKDINCFEEDLASFCPHPPHEWNYLYTVNPIIKD